MPSQATAPNLIVVAHPEIEAEPIPADVEIRSTAREPVTDPTLGIAVHVEWTGTPQHRLVSIGDSLTHGFASGAVFRTDLSYSAIIARALGWGGLRYPRYGGLGGLPLNIELLLRELERDFGAALDWWELPHALLRGLGFLDAVEDYWERGPGAVSPPATATNHVLAVYGYDLRDALAQTHRKCQARIARPADDVVRQVVQNAGDRAALRVLPSARVADRDRTLLDAAVTLGRETGDPDDPAQDPGHGIETLVVFLGANNALRAVVDLRVAWSGDGYDDPVRKSVYTVWRPTHFTTELDRVVAKVRRIKARHVIWCTVPHVTIPPVARGVGTKIGPGSRYFPYYTRPWISDDDFDPDRDPAITAAEARAVDSAIDQYNEAITDVVRQAREDGRDWYLLDTAGLLDRLASRRYALDPDARPDWWEPYPLPAELAGLDPAPDTRFLTADPSGLRATGGLFSLDGVHPTTVGYGIIAQELITVMRRAGVECDDVDFGRLVRLDTLVTRPPANITSGLGVLAWGDEALDLLGRAMFWR